MRLTGYVDTEQIAEALAISESWLVEEFEEVGMDSQLTLYGKPHYRATLVERWLHDRMNAVKCEQDRCADITRGETTLELHPSGHTQGIGID